MTVSLPGTANLFGGGRRWPGRVTDLRISDVPGTPLTAWRVVEGVLHVRFGDGARDDILVCVCDRRHWIVETRAIGGRGVLLVKCHGCGTARDLPLAAP